MATNKDLYYKLKNLKNKYLTDGAIKSLLFAANDIENFTELIKIFNDECKDETKFNNMLERVLKGEPLQYVIGVSQFLELFLNVNPDVLIPRLETEQLAFIIRDMYKNEESKKLNVIDICTGSGCLALSVKNRFKNFDVDAIDISSKALDVARQNACKYQLNVNFIEGNLIDPLLESDKKYDILICNPPYIADTKTIDEQVLKYEPHLALLADPAWKFYERIFQYHHFFMKKNFVMFFEIGEDMEKDLTNLINLNFNNVSFVFKKDNYGKTRFLIIEGVNNGPLPEC